MAKHAVAYVCSGGYLFQTVVSAIQARAHSSAAADVIVVLLREDAATASEAERLFARISAENDVQLVGVDKGPLEGLGPAYGRLFLDQFLPDVEELLYLDGDTQILGSLDPLLFADAPRDGALGARDPLVFIQQAVPSYRTGIEEVWDASGIDPEIRARYINSGMIRLSRNALGRLRESALALHASKGDFVRFGDQDLINLALGDRVGLVSMKWNFPGFLLDSQVSDQIEPRILHFMSNPRPWNAPLWPWGRRYFEPYRDFVEHYPAARPYWDRVAGAKRLRYTAQQFYKRIVERPKWQTEAVALALTALASSERSLTPPPGRSSSIN